jgi:hypothetical protein
MSDYPEHDPDFVPGFGPVPGSGFGIDPPGRPVAAGRPRVAPLRTDALIHDLAIVLRGVLHPSVEIGPPARLASRRLADVLGIEDGEMVRDVETRLRSALASGESGR